MVLLTLTVDQLEQRTGQMITAHGSTDLIVLCLSCGFNHCEFRIMDGR